MSIVMFVPDFENLVTVCCKECCAIVAERVPIQEVSEWSKAGLEVKCFDCDPNEPDTIPVQLVEFRTHWLLGLGASVFLAEWIGDGENFHQTHIRLSKISLTTYFYLKIGYGPKYLFPLSSSLYLNKISESEAFRNEI